MLMEEVLLFYRLLFVAVATRARENLAITTLPFPLAPDTVRLSAHIEA